MTDQATAVVDPQSTESVTPENMDKPERASWLKTGELPTRPIKAGPASVKADEQAAASEKTPASEAGKQEQPKKRATAADRKEELGAEIKQLLERRAVLKEDSFWQEFEDFQKSKTSKAAPSTAEIKAPAITEVKEPVAPERPKRPDLTEFKTVEQYNVAMDKYDAEMSNYQAQKQAFDDAKAQAEKGKAEVQAFNKAVEDKWKGMVSMAEEKHSDFKEIALSDALAKQIPAGSSVDEWVLQSEVGAEILYHFGQDNEDLKRILALPRAKQHRELAKLEDSLSGDAGKRESKSAATDEVPQKVKRVTDAPKPPLEVGGKGTASEDPLNAALAAAKKGDIRSYFDLANERDIARRKRGK